MEVAAVVAVAMTPVAVEEAAALAPAGKVAPAPAEVKPSSGA